MLREMLAANLFQWMLIFSRLGAAMMFMPGFNSSMVSARARLLFALILSFLLLPVLSAKLPAAPATPIGLFLLIAAEAGFGIFIGLVVQVMLSALDTAGSAIGYATGLTNMFTYDPISEQQSALMTGFLNLVAVTLIFASNCHHLMLHAIVDSYSILAPGQPLPFDDLSQILVRSLSSASTMGLRLAAPFLVFSITFNTGLALISRLVPQIQVFLVGLPMQIMGGLIILMITLPAIMLLFINSLSEGLASFMSFG
jgi:flagellar biosynthetic protein FliR